VTEHETPEGPGDEIAMGDRAAEAVDHLQAAARELIAAARGFLDVAQQVVEDPKATESVVESLTGLVESVRNSATTGDAPFERIDVD